MADTSIPGPPDFPSTQWSRLGQGDRDTPGLDFFAAHYWKPVYLYVRRKWRRSNEDSKDLTQAFFAELIRTGFLAKADPDRGSFRRFLKASLENYLCKQHRDAGADKRGGGKAPLSLDGLEALDTLVAREGDPEALFDREWLEAVFERALPRMKALYDREGRQVAFELFREYEIDRPAEGGATYEGLAKRHGVSTSDVRNWLHVARERWRKAVLEELRETCRSAEDFEAEIKATLGE